MKSTSAYFYSIFATTLVLVVMGAVFIMAYEARQVSVNLKENLTVEVVLGDEATADSINALKSEISKRTYVKKVTYVSKEQAAESLKKELGDNYLTILGYNPLYPSFRVNLNEAYANQKSFERVQRELSELSGVQQVNIQKSLLTELDKTLRNFTFLGLFIGALFLAFAVSLIFSAIKLDIFSRRQVIKSMQLFGATRWFIVKPYLGRSLFNGLISGLLATAALYGISYYLDYEFPGLGLTADLIIFAMLLSALLVLGIIISFLSTLIALTKYLNYKLDDLY
jgi:cell division transport system permease protein